jgi:hypothetical protein
MYNLTPSGDFRANVPENSKKNGHFILKSCVPPVLAVNNIFCSGCVNELRKG